MSAGPFYGKYPGTVRNNIDTNQKGRLLVEVGDVGGNMISTWASPCLPVVGPNMGIFTVPPIGAGVWVEFVRGDPDFPVWTGGFYSEADVPALARIVPPGLSGITLQTQLKNGIVISDAPGPTGGILIQTTSGAMIAVNDIGITISNGKGAVLTLTGPTVDVNLGALTIV
jgi:uncharacterized protein involved in type VI secretion and phage assembly